MLMRRLEGSHRKWAEELHGVFWAYWATPKTAMQETPYSLVYDTEAIITTEMHVRTTVSGSTSQEENDELMSLSLDLLDEKRGAVQLRKWSYQQDVAKNNNKKVRTRTFQQGDWVLRRVGDSTKDKAAGKLSPGWEGPYTIIEVREKEPTRCKKAKVKYNQTARTPYTSKFIISKKDIRSMISISLLYTI